MTQQKWEPGTVALVDWEGESVVRILSKYGHTFGSDRSAWWGPEGYLRCEAEAIKGIRPLLVLDPDNPDQMRELAKTFGGKRWPGQLGVVSDSTYEALTAAVRAMLPKPTPVKPAEPTGLGAVVEDGDGDFWVYGGMRSILDGETRIWLHAEKKDTYAKINAVKVLSEGVTR